ncbi:Gfo/Idh/MocA family oxidoreductase [Streptomyces niveiscabiei]|uniref:Gfo/Idh/MocA family protein n=1 Tax=Streptomyces niveiscabiei TaxID=164115 RepID=UPI0029B62912|nr:Gfo/Idh/MocA family oxidoreductase [Streptomyces niveiscabiei]MDX3382407.1 Gfo/Idh/MocA family oxidoreductase [Streptomyces niveiscabiei]
MPRDTARRRVAVVGLGSRARLFVNALAGPYADRYELAGFCDVNSRRTAVHNEWLGRSVPAYPVGEFDEMLRRERVGLVVVCSVDRTHDEYIVRALDAGCDVVTEKPMTTDADKARRILAARERTGRNVRVAFNYRYNPVHSAVRELLADGAVGEVGSVHFEWLLDLRHGADYFRRWHREKANSGGLMVHKATHHFDLVNWWLGSSPELVYAQGALFFYGPEAGRRRGLAREYDRAHGQPAAASDPFALHLADDPDLKSLYLDAESEDGYHRDRNVFAPGVTIEDDMAVLVRYASGTSLTYHLTAYAPWEGYRIAFNGSEGRLELLVEETTWTPRPVSPASAHGVEANTGRTELLLRRSWERPREIKVASGEGGHGGGDARMLEDLFGTRAPDPLGRAADAVDGARSLVTGLAANRSFETGAVVRTRDLLDL